MGDDEHETGLSASATTLPRVLGTDWVVVLVDRSASMDAIRQPTIQGLNAFIAQQRDKARTNVRIVQFGTDDEGRMQLEPMFDARLHSTESIAIERAAYRPRGDTPLFAAVLTTIEQLEHDVGAHDHALVVVQTDGIENASPPEFTLEGVRARIAEKQRGGWVFAYLGAELDSWRTGQGLGIGMLNSFSYSPTPQGVRAAFQRASEGVDRWRDNRTLAGRRFFPLQLPAPGDVS